MVASRTTVLLPSRRTVLRGVKLVQNSGEPRGRGLGPVAAAGHGGLGGDGVVGGVLERADVEVALVADGLGALLAEDEDDDEDDEGEAEDEEAGVPGRKKRPEMKFA